MTDFLSFRKGRNENFAFVLCLFTLVREQSGASHNLSINRYRGANVEDMRSRSSLTINTRATTYRPPWIVTHRKQYKPTTKDSGP